MGIPTNEQETVICFGRTDEIATVSTSDSTVMTKLDKLVADESTDWNLDRAETQDGEVVEKFYSVPKKFISFRGKKRTITEEQRQAAAERLKQYQASKEK